MVRFDDLFCFCFSCQLADLKSGEYKLYAVSIPSLADVTGFPVSIEGNYANNDHTR